jgi:hypothetical protein
MNKISKLDEKQLIGVWLLAKKRLKINKLRLK